VDILQLLFKQVCAEVRARSSCRVSQRREARKRKVKILEARRTFLISLQPVAASSAEVTSERYEH